MSYRIYLIEELSSGPNKIELDTEDIDLRTVFSVADVTDISARRDPSTKQIEFKGTKTNNIAFGSMFHLNKRTDHALDNKLGFNLSPLRPVECLVYEDSTEIFRGSLRVVKVKNDGYNVSYLTIITTAVTDFRYIVANKDLSELDFTDIRHYWHWSVIKASWTQYTQRYDKSTDTYSNVPFEKGKGYVYPFVDYGEVFKFPDSNESSVRMINLVPLKSFRPALYAKEILTRIFDQEGLEGFTFEFRDASPLKTVEKKFNSLILLDNSEKLVTRTNATKIYLSRTISTTTEWQNDSQYGLLAENQLDMPIMLDQGITAHPCLSYSGTYRGISNAVMDVLQTFTTDGVISIKLNHFKNIYVLNPVLKVSVQLVERDYVVPGTSEFDAYGDDNTWKVIASSSFTAPYNQALAPTVTFDVAEHMFEEGKQIGLRFLLADGYFTGLALGHNFVEYEIAPALSFLALPKDQANGMMALDMREGFPLTPSAPTGIQQIDFIKSLMTLMNLYLYSEPTRPKHLIFETYDQYYSQTAAGLIGTRALDWTDKLDLSGGYDITHNMSLPKKYNFSFKPDSDYINKNYQDSFFEPYGSHQLVDSLGITDQKKVDVIFSPTPAVELAVTDRIHPSVYQLDGGKVKPVRSNVRIQFYNGMKTCSKYSVAKDVFANTWLTFPIEQNLSAYPNCSEYYFNEGPNNQTVSDVLQFGTPPRAYYLNRPTFSKAPNIYGNYYKQQLLELIDPNTFFIECRMYLNEIDIANLDLRRPIFLDTGFDGHNYFKVLSVEYQNNAKTARVHLQSIAV